MQSHRDRQLGFTLIELMIGMTISLISVLAMLSLYKTSANITAASKLGANIDGQIAAGLLAADRFMQGAGYKGGDSTASSASYNSDLVLITGAALTGSTLSGTAYTATPTTIPTAGNALVWLYNASGTYQLQGLYAAPSSAGGGLYMLTATVAGSPPSLSTSTTWSGATWTSQVLIAAPAVTIPNATSAGQASISIYSSGSTSQCHPFSGAPAIAGGRYWASLSVTGYAGNSQTLNAVTCLVNIAA